VLPKENTLLQREVEKIKKISEAREMILNEKKTAIFVANFTHNHKFKPLITIPRQELPLQVVLESKLLGYWLDTTRTPSKHIQYTTGIAYKRLWAISRLKANHVSKRKIVKFFQMKIHSVLESSCVSFSMMKENDWEIIERPVKILLKILQGPNYTDLKTSLATYFHLGITFMSSGSSP
jgi:hypothetical protein